MSICTFEWEKGAQSSPLVVYTLSSLDINLLDQITYDFLFCIFSRELGLEKATSLLNEIREKHINPNRVLYNSIIQAFGRYNFLKSYLCSQKSMFTVPH